MEHSVPRIIPPSQCYSCGCQKFHKDERRVYTYQDYINNNTLMVQVHRRRYRCANCGTKQWDQYAEHPRTQEKRTGLFSGKPL